MPLRLALILCLFLLPAAARADDYAEGTSANLARALVRFHAFDIKDDAMLDEYMFVTDCEIVENYYDNDFQWSRVRAMARDSIKTNIATFPGGFHYDAKLQLDRYDFKSKTFRFTAKSTVLAVNSYTFRLPSNYTCADHELRFFPEFFTIVTDTPVSIRGLDMSEEDGKALLRRLDEDGNLDRIIYTRFNLRIIKIDPLHKTQKGGGLEEYDQDGDQVGIRSVRLDARLDSVDFYEDADMTKLVYNYQP